MALLCQLRLDHFLSSRKDIHLKLNTIETEGVCSGERSIIDLILLLLLVQPLLRTRSRLLRRLGSCLRSWRLDRSLFKNLTNELSCATSWFDPFIPCELASVLGYRDAVLVLLRRRQRLLTTVVLGRWEHAVDCGLLHNIHLLMFFVFC